MTASAQSRLRYAFTGQLRDPATTLQHHRARWLATARGQWVSHDQFADFPDNFLSAIGYVGSNPIAKRDVFGTFTLVEVAVSVAIAGVLGGICGGVEALLDNDEETTFLGGFAWGLALGVGMALLLVSAPMWLAQAAAVLGAGVGGFFVGMAINERNWKLAAWRVFLLTVMIFAASGSGQRFFKSALEKCRSKLGFGRGKTLFEELGIKPGKGFDTDVPSARNGESYITYVFEDKAGNTVYVGRASGKGTPKQVLRARIRKGHKHWKPEQGYKKKVVDVQKSLDACQGAEDVFIQGYRELGAPLTNKIEALGLQEPSFDASVAKMDSFFAELFSR